MCCNFKSKCWQICIGVLLLLLSIVIALTEIGNILVEFWHTNVFAGLWTSLLVFQSAIAVISTPCTSKRCCFIYYIVADILALVGLGALIGFDIYFLIYPYACLLTSTCTSNPAVTSYQFMQTLPAFTSYTSYDSKRLFFYIQIGCAGLCFLILLIHLIVSCINIRKRKRPPSLPPQPKRTSKVKPPPPEKSITDEPLPPIWKKIQLEKQTQPPPWSISNPIIEQSSYIPPF